jgi:hypothetical protein
MGVVLTTAIVLGLVSAILEFRLKFIGKLSRRNPKAGLAASFGLSWILGAMFGVGGLIAFLGGLISTVMTDPVYAGQRKLAKSSPKTRALVAETKATYAPLLKGSAKGIGLAIASPVIVPVLVRRKYRSLRGLAA